MAKAVDIHAELHSGLNAGDISSAIELCDALGRVLEEDRSEAFRSSARIKHLELTMKKLQTELNEKDERIAVLSRELWAKKAETFDPPEGGDTNQGDEPSQDRQSDPKGKAKKSSKNYAANSPNEPKKQSTGRGTTDWSCFDPRPFNKFFPIWHFADWLGDKCALMIIRDLFQDGDRTFSQFRAQAGGFSPNTLSSRLKRLEDAKLIEMVKYQDHPPRFQYRLTERGRSIGPVFEAMFDWGSTKVGEI